MNFVKITATNFLTFKELSYNFQNGQSVLVQGENLSDSGQESNGSGKSAFAAIIEYCLIHSTSRKTLDKDLVTWGEREAYISLEINCTERNESLLIERVIDVKNGGSSQLSVNNKIKYSYEDRQVDEIDKFIEAWIGISKSDIQNYFLISKFKYQSFYSASNTQLNQLIGRFSNASIIEGIDKDILSDVDKLEKRRQVLRDSKNKLLGNIEAYQSNLESAKLVTKEELFNQAVKELDNKILDLEGAIANTTEKTQQKLDRIKVYQHKIEEVNASLIERKGELQSVKVVDFDDKLNGISENLKLWDSKQDQYKNQINDVEKEVSSINKMMQDIELNLKGTVQCPNCKHEFVVGKENVNVEEERASLEEILLLQKDFESEISKIKSNISLCDAEIIKLKQEKRLSQQEEEIHNETKRRIEKRIYDLEGEVNSYKTNIDIGFKDIELLEKSIIGYKKDISDLEFKKNNLDPNSFDNKEQIESIQQLILNCEKDIEDIDKRDEEFEVEISEIKRWSNIFIEFRQYISVKVLKILQGYVNKFLEELKTDLRVQIEGFKLKADGTTSDKITATIVRDGLTRDFNTFSGGERARLEAAVILAVQKAINSTHKFGGIDFTIIDEILESADSEGVTNLMKAFNELPKTIMLITHVPVKSFEFPILKIVKQNGYSKIIL